MVDGSTRLGVFMKILLPLMGPGLVATSVFAFITTWNEYIFARVLLNDQSKQTVTVWLSYFLGIEPAHRLGRADGRVDADRDPGRHLLPARPAQDRVRADRRGGARLSELERLAAACIFPSFPGARAARLGSALPRRGRRRLRALRVQRAVARGARGALRVASRGARRRAARDRRGRRRRDAARVADRQLVSRRRRARRRSTSRRRPRRSPPRSPPSSAAVGVNWNLAPVADVNVPANPVIGSRAYGSDRCARRAPRRGVRPRHAVAARRRVREALPRPRRDRAGLAPRASRPSSATSRRASSRSARRSQPACRRS